jgi:hypothetical protein
MQLEELYPVVDNRRSDVETSPLYFRIWLVFALGEKTQAKNCAVRKGGLPPQFGCQST